METGRCFVMACMLVLLVALFTAGCGDGDCTENCSCKDACKNLTEVCQPSMSYSWCVDDCKGTNGQHPWAQQTIDCWAAGCSGNYCW